MTPNYTIRAATPDDAAQAVPLIYASGPAAFDHVFSHPRKGTALDFLHFAFAKRGGEMGFDNHILLIDDVGELLGIGAVWTGRATFRFTLAIAWKILCFYGLIDGIGVMLRGLRFESMVRPPKRNEAVVAHIAVCEHQRGKGLGEKLMREMIQRARKTDAVKLVLDVTVVNSNAQRLYERLGFGVARTSDICLHRPGYVPVPGHHRMELMLDLTQC